MADRLRIALAQLDMLVGDVVGNVIKIAEAVARASDEFQADVIILPELALTGYPPEDLLLRPGLHRQVLRGLETLKRDVAGIDVIVGYPAPGPEGLFNSASLIRDGVIVAGITQPLAVVPVELGPRPVGKFIQGHLDLE